MLTNRAENTISEVNFSRLIAGLLSQRNIFKYNSFFLHYNSIIEITMQDRSHMCSADYLDSITHPVTGLFYLSGITNSSQRAQCGALQVCHMIYDKLKFLHQHKCILLLSSRNINGSDQCLAIVDNGLGRVMTLSLTVPTAKINAISTRKKK